MTEYIQFDSAKLVALKESISEAEAEGTDTFEFEGHEMVVAYAKYLVEHLEQQGI